jgi:iron complex outermembrane recepter protein
MPMARNRPFTLLTILLLAATSLAQMQVASSNEGDKPLKQLSLQELAQIEVTTTSKEPVRANQTAAATYVVTDEEIRRSGATSIADALRLVPGVEVGRIDSHTWAVGMRGLQNNFSKSVLVLIDGRSVYTPLFAGVYWDVQDMILQDIDRIEVIRGPGATIWGPNAVNGVINIITKDSADTQGALVSVSGGNVDRTIESVRYGGRFGKRLTYRLYAKGFTRSPEFHTDGLNYDAWHQERGGFRTDWNTDRDSVMVESDIYGGTSPRLLGTALSDDSVAGGDVVARWRRKFANGSDMYLQSYFDRTIRTGLSIGETRNTIDIDFLHHFEAGRHEISWGGGLRWSPNLVIAPTESVKVLPATTTDHQHSLFGQDEIHFFDKRVSLTVGAKLEHNNFNGLDVQPTLRLLYAPSDRHSFWAAVTRSIAIPSRIEEGFLLEGGPPGGAVIRLSGTPNFKSEAVIGYEAGFRQMIGKKVYVDVAAFHNNYQDLQSFTAPTVSVVTPPPPHLLLSLQYANDIAGTTNGVEIAPTWQATSWWRLTGSYSYVGIDMHANAATADISSTGSVRTYEGSAPHHQMVVQSNFNIGKSLEFDQFLRTASSLPAQKVPSYTTLDARFGYTFKSFEFSVVGQNLLQPHHFEWGTGDPNQSLVGIKRAVYGQITFRK